MELDRSALMALAQQHFFTPVSSIASEEGTLLLQKISVPTLDITGRKQVPTFTSEDFFAAWSAGNYQCLTLVGIDLAVALPCNVGLLVNPGTSGSLALSPDEVALLADLSDRSEESSALELLTEEESDVPRQIATPAQVEARMVIALEKHNDVHEAYYVESQSEHTEAILGLLTARLSPEQRFYLLTDIGDVARNLFGSAGAIEVFDDLNSETSSSWELFSSKNPFYVRDAADGDSSTVSSGKKPNIHASSRSRRMWL